jgi:hypothetical protein
LQFWLSCPDLDLQVGFLITKSMYVTIALLQVEQSQMRKKLKNYHHLKVFSRAVFL